MRRRLETPPGTDVTMNRSERDERQVGKGKMKRHAEGESTQPHQMHGNHPCRCRGRAHEDCHENERDQGGRPTNNCVKVFVPVLPRREERRNVLDEKCAEIPGPCKV